MNVRHKRAVSAVVLVLIATTSGCGSGIDQAVFGAVEAAGRTTLDILLTELANGIAETFEQDQVNPE